MPMGGDRERGASKAKAGRSPRNPAKAVGPLGLRVREVRISEQLAYQLLAFLSRYSADVRNLQRFLEASGSEPELLRGYLEAMAYGDCKDAERLAKALQRAVDALDEGGDA